MDSHDELTTLKTGRLSSTSHDRLSRRYISGSNFAMNIIELLRHEASWHSRNEGLYFEGLGEGLVIIPINYMRTCSCKNLAGNWREALDLSTRVCV